MLRELCCSSGLFIELSSPPRAPAEYSRGRVCSGGAQGRCRGCCGRKTTPCQRRKPLLFCNPHWRSDVQSHVRGWAQETRWVNAASWCFVQCCFQKQHENILVSIHTSHYNMNKDASHWFCLRICSCVMWFMFGVDSEGEDRSHCYTRLHPERSRTPQDPIR